MAADLTAKDAWEKTKNSEVFIAEKNKVFADIENITLEGKDFLSTEKISPQLERYLTELGFDVNSDYSSNTTIINW